MNNTFKRAAVALLVMGTFTTLAGCDKGLSKGKAEEILSNVTYTWDGTEVSSDFILPAVLVYEETTKYNVTWTSNNNAIALEHRDAVTEGSDPDYLAKVVFPESETQNVTLTLTLGKASKDFYVRVNPIDVYTIAANFTFAKDKATVVEDFKVPTEHACQGKTATITWSVPAAYGNLLSVGEVANKEQTIKVNPSALDPEARIAAKFVYNNEETTKEWRLTVSKQLTHFEEVSRWYNTAGASIDVEGTVVAIGAEWDSSYKNMNIFVLDNDGCTGFYFYRVKAGTGVNGADVKVGSKVKVEAAVSYSHNGLIEASATGTITKLDNSGAATYNPKAAENVKAIDDLLVSGAQELTRQESRYVSIKNWEVTAVNNTSDSGLMVLTKDGQDVTVNMTKYYAGSYKFEDNDPNSEYQKIKAAIGTFNVGDYVNLTGIYSYNNKPIISIQAAADLTAGEKDEAATAGSKVKSLVTGNKTKIPSSLIISDKDIAMEASTADVTAAYEVIGPSAIVSATENVFSVKPSQEDKVNVKATYTCGTFSTSEMFSIYSQKLSDAEAAEKECLNFTFKTKEFGPGVHKDDLQFKGNFLTDVNVFSYSKPEDATYDFVTFAADKWTVGVIAEDTEIKVKVTATVGAESASKVLKVTVKAPNALKNLTEFRALKDGEWAEVSFTYISGKTGASNKFCITDGTDAIYSKNKSNAITSGKTVTAYVSKATSYGAAVVDQIIEKTTLDSVTDLTFGKTVTAYTAEEISEAVKAAKDVDAALAPYIGKYVEITGKLKGSYLNITTADGKIQTTYTYTSEFANALKDSADDGKMVKAYGYVTGINNKADGQIQFFILDYTVIEA